MHCLVQATRSTSLKSLDLVFKILKLELFWIAPVGRSQFYLCKRIFLVDLRSIYYLSKIQMMIALIEKHCVKLKSVKVITEITEFSIIQN